MDVDFVKSKLRQHGEIIVTLENDDEYELHLDVNFNSYTVEDEDSGEKKDVEVVEFVDESGHKHSFQPSKIVAIETHPSKKL